MNKEIPADILKQIEDEAEYRYDIMHDGQAHRDKMMFRRKAFIEGAKFALSLSPSSGEGEASGKEPKWLDLTLSELVEQSLKLGYVPIFKFVDKADEAEPRNPQTITNDRRK